MRQFTKGPGIIRYGLYKALLVTKNHSFDAEQKVVRAFKLKLDVVTGN